VRPEREDPRAVDIRPVEDDLDAHPTGNVEAITEPLVRRPISG
jgi:hypothetical protein